MQFKLLVILNKQNIMAKVKIAERYIGDDEKVFIIAEIGINHNGSLENALRLIDGAKYAGCDAVKFQKRTPELCVPKDQWLIRTRNTMGKNDLY